MSRVLVIEDDVDCRELVMEILAITGHEVREEATGQDGLAAAVEALPDLVMLDISLSGSDFDGVETMRRIRALPGGAALPIVAVSAHAFAEARERALAAGFDAYVSKPFDFDTIDDVLNRFLTKEGTR